MVRGLLWLFLLAGALGGFLWMRSRDAVAPEAVPRPGVDSGRTDRDDGSFQEFVIGEPVAVADVEPDGDPEAARWIERNNEAAERLAAGELREAVELFEACHEALPEHTVIRRNLVEALVRLAADEREGAGDLEDAVEHLARAVELGGDRGDIEALRATLERWRRELELAEDHWTDRSLYFELSYDADRRDLVQRALELLQRLERDYADLRDWFGIDPVMDGGRPIRVVLHGEDDFADVTGLGDWAGGSFDGVIRVPTAAIGTDEPRVLRTLRHELVHAFVHEVGGQRVPGWLNEGLAQWLEGSADGATRDLRVAAARRLIEGRPLFSLDSLAGNLAAWDDTDEIRRAYAQSLLVVRLVAEEPAYGEEALRRMVLACGRGESPTEAFQAWTGVPFGAVLEALERER